jgi:hypothetical protein
MSTQAPITTEPTACSTNWLTRLACKLQSLVEPLCEKRSDFRLNSAEFKDLTFELMGSAPGIDVMLMSAKWRGFEAVVLNDIILLWQERHNQTIVLSKGAQAILAPRLTPWNKMGLSAWKAFSVGTECSCCWGLRFIALTAVSFSIGFLTRSFL